MADDRTDVASTGDGGQGGARNVGDHDDGSPIRHTVRHSRRRFLALTGAFIAGAAGVAGLFRWLAGGGSSGDGRGAAPGTSDFPTLNVEAVPRVAPADWAIVVDGLVDKPLRIDHATWQTLERREETADFHCVEGWSVDGLRWAGVTPKTLLDLAGLKSDATAVTFHAYGGVYADSLPMAQTQADTTLLADTLDGDPLPAEHGGPVRLVIPSQLGYKNVKWVTRLEVTAEPTSGYWEQRGYPAKAPVD